MNEKVPKGNRIQIREYKMYFFHTKSIIRKPKFRLLWGPEKHKGHRMTTVVIKFLFIDLMVQEHIYTCHANGSMIYCYPHSQSPCFSFGFRNLHFSLGFQQTMNYWYLFYFSQKPGFDSLWKLSPLERICMKCQNLFSGKIRKQYFKMSSVDIFIQNAKRKIKINSKKKQVE